MNILLTGASGMVGSNILEHQNVTKYRFFTPSSTELNLLHYLEIVNFFSQNHIDMVIHCAGMVGGIQANIRDQVGFLNTNLLMGINLVNASYAAGVKKLINLGSSCMYPMNYKNPLKEEYLLNAPLEPTNEGYALAKITVAKLCEYMSKQYKIDYKTIIPCNIYGRWDKFEDKHSHLIPAVIKKIHHAKINKQPVVEMWGNGLARREFMYAADLADSIFIVLENLLEVGYYTNIGFGYDYSVNDYYKLIANVIGYHGDFTHDLSKPSGMQYKLMDTSKIKNLGWIPRYTLEDGLIKTYNFFLKVEDN